MDFRRIHSRWEYLFRQREAQPEKPSLAQLYTFPLNFQFAIEDGLFRQDLADQQTVPQQANPPSKPTESAVETDDVDSDYDFLVDDFEAEAKMVQLVEVEDEHFQHAQEGPVEDDGDFTDTDSEISNDSDYDPSQETLAERISALRDIVPPTTRAWFWNKYQATHRVVKGVIFFAGRSMWSISVSALLIGVPFALCWAEEQQVIAMEQEARMREMGADVLTAGGGAGGEGSTADLVGQHLGKEGGVEVKAAGL
ncbi:hypothetical protein KVR01_004826 [Diaporthe batatas]|uniref:uncharacterized protein n=1 Tax=Diaporthe batatas TaxID=748121 RepID=UPI001D04F7E4|nr:uncharacterized protein KVR01_004826 [Diaporthe batatas]KAG8166274.1 hypothetical protein KVR01_004826 [Diaporthe batatas]